MEGISFPDADWIERNISLDPSILTSVISNINSSNEVCKDYRDLCFYIFLIYIYENWKKIYSPLYTLENIVDVYRDSDAIWVGDGALPHKLAGISEGPDGLNEKDEEIEIRFKSFLKPYIEEIKKRGLVVRNDNYPGLR